MLKLIISVILVASMAMAQSSEEVVELNSGEQQQQSSPAAVVAVWKLISPDDELPQQLAAFAARQMSTKGARMKLSSLDSAMAKDEGDSKLFKLKVTLQRYTVGMPLDAMKTSKKDILFCTLDTKTDASEQQWSLESFGCTLPALVRRRRPKVSSTTTTTTTTTTTPAPAPLDDLEVSKAPIEEMLDNGLDVGRETRKLHRQRLYHAPSFYQRMALGRSADSNNIHEPVTLFELRYPSKRQTKSPIPPPIPFYKPIWMHQQQVPIPIYQRYQRTYLRPKYY